MQRIVQRYHDDIANDTIDALTLDSNQGDTGDSDETDSGGEEPSLAERLGGIDLSGELDDSAVGAIWHQMTEEERAGFVDLLGGHGIESIATPWRSWWCKADEPKVTLIDDNGEAAKEDNAEQSPVPPVLDI
ncbi:Zinc finger HIT domain-containing protein 2, partial [Coemansia spiralis]